ncbi:Nucleolar protein 12 [Exophiala dermatitidis]|nr:Nucleolar protein 12 [Exophiala dermatitidis]KAJ4527223.1 Nucleolar protein 12 [Exophiala dermatitidis]KAJ4577336.1 Nucleolar protein 12 [Exophiala dermatitidis]KAJ4599409.1 Nucleolar protein 12 [Exophiala dermatitidis]KAJ4605059.1 Nucleolar protein 12 [Exophiala dermatitidis]
MGKRKQADSQSGTSATTPILAKDAAIDPSLASLFASSAGPVKVPARAVSSTKPAPVRREAASDDETSSGEDDEDDSQSSDTSPDGAAEASIAALAASTAERPRKRRRMADAEDLEASYFHRLEREEERELQKSAAKTENTEGDSSSEEEEEDGDATSSSDSDDTSTGQPAVDEIPRHEIFDKKLNNADKSKRTVFLGNVSTDAIKLKRAKKILSRHLRSALKTPAQGPRLGKLESLRFRSTAYHSDAGPKKATFAKKELMDETTPSTNAYAVFTTEEAAKHVAKKLNGSVVLDRHLRVDYMGKPAEIDHRRCIFVGNLSFVSKETAGNDEDDEAKRRRAAAKEPADPEEGLWRTFSKVGKVESVRVVRDQETRVSKGIAYVQFESENSVEGALLMNDKKFPPMLPRKLRVMRARRMPSKSKPPTAGSKSRFPGAGRDRRSSGPDRKAGFVFEGHRASSTSKGTTGGHKKRHKKRPTTRSSRRGAAFKAAGGKKKSEGKS